MSHFGIKLNLVESATFQSVLSRGAVDVCSIGMTQKGEADTERRYFEGYWDIVLEGGRRTKKGKVY